MNKRSNEKISEVLGIAPIPEAQMQEEKKDLPVPVEQTSPSTAVADQDFSESREYLKEVLEETMDTIKELRTIAAATESARHYEVLAALLKTAADANEKLLKISKDHKDITRNDVRNQDQVQPQQTINVQNAVFTGSTADLAKLVQQQREQQNGSNGSQT